MLELATRAKEVVDLQAQIAKIQDQYTCLLTRQHALRITASTPKP